MTTHLNGQIDLINQYDGSGKKTGHWVKYLDANLNPTDSLTSYFYGYEYYDHGKRIFKFHKDKRNKNYRHSFVAETQKAGNPRILDGTFSWYSNDDSLPDVVEKYKLGQPVTQTAYHQCEFHPRYISEYLDFTRQYNNTVGSYYYEFERKKYWFHKVGKKWRSTKID